MAIQIRRGAATDFDPTKMVAGELAVSTDGTRKVWATGSAGDCWELAHSDVIASEFSAETAYTKGDYVLYSSKLYRFTADHSAGAWSDTDVEEVTVTGQIENAEEDISKKADADGTYPNLTSGYASQLVSSVEYNNKVPFLFRPTAGGQKGLSDRVYRKIVGGSVGWNQLVQNGNFVDTSVWTKGGCSLSVINNIATITKTSETDINFYQAISKKSGHKYFLKFCAYADKTFSLAVNWGENLFNENLLTSKKFFYIVISSPTGNENLNFYVPNSRLDVNEKYYLEDVNLIDLTQLLGSTIADYLYTLESGTAGAGVAKLKEWGFCQKDYYAYDAGSLQSVKTSGIESVGFNQWDEEWEVGGINHSTGADNDNATNVIRSKNYIPCLSNTVYYFCNKKNAGSPYIHYYDANKSFLSYAEVSRNTTFTTPTNAFYIRFNMDTGYGTSYSNDICINLSNPTLNGTYQPYVKHTYALDSDLVLRGIAKKDSNGNLYYDGDTYESDGTVTRKYGIVDLGTLTWTTQSDINQMSYYSEILTNALKPSSSTVVANIICANYARRNTNAFVSSGSDKVIGLSTSGRVNVNDNNYTTEQSFKTAMSGVYLIYELATPTTESADTYTNPQVVDNLGTERFIDGRDVEVPVGHDSEYPADLTGAIERVMVQVPEAPSSNGTYTLKCTVSGGVPSYSWST